MLQGAPVRSGLDANPVVLPEFFPVDAATNRFCLCTPVVTLWHPSSNGSKLADCEAWRTTLSCTDGMQRHVNQQLQSVSHAGVWDLLKSTPQGLTETDVFRLSRAETEIFNYQSLTMCFKPVAYDSDARSRPKLAMPRARPLITFKFSEFSNVNNENDEFTATGKRSLPHDLTSGDKRTRGQLSSAWNWDNDRRFELWNFMLMLERYEAWGTPRGDWGIDNLATPLK